MHLINYSRVGWESWDVERQPLIPERMPILLDDDLRFEDAPGVLRPTTVGNRWLRELPLNGAPAARTWRNNASSLYEWMTFLQDRGVHPLGNRQELRAALSMYAEFRFTGPLNKRWDGTTWNLHMGILSAFYRWARDEHFADAAPFTYRIQDPGHLPPRRPARRDRAAAPATGPARKRTRAPHPWDDRPGAG
ncbi:hypothetical protein ACFWM0_06210 [Streptomyces sp. NPDC058405]|uniref:hypothetical protein n=1 Tax=unclassified Streptomyces TaxID=2593676 RepID=UPI003667F4DE